MKKILKIIICITSVILSSITIFLLKTIDLIPRKIFIITILGIVLINLIVLILNIVNKKILNIIGIILGLIVIIINYTGIYYLNKTNNFLNKSFNGQNIETNTYYIIALKSKNYKEENIKGDISYYKNMPNKDTVIDSLNKTYELNYNEYDSINDIYNDLLEEKIELVITESTSYNIIRNSNNKINDNCTIIKEINIEKKLANTQNKEKAINIYIVGNDFAGLNDFNMIVTINNETKKILLTSIPRDYHIEVAGMEGMYDNITYMSALGIDTSIKSLEKFFDTTIDYYVKINTSSLVKLVDFVDGIEFCSDYEYITTHAMVLDTYDDRLGEKLYVKKGCQHLNGIETLTVARERKKIPGSDVARQNNCRKIIMAIINKLKNTNTITNYNKLLDNLSDAYETNIPKKIIQAMGKDALDYSKWEILEQSVWGTDVIGYVHLNTVRDYTMTPDYSSVEPAINKIHELGK